MKMIQRIALKQNASWRKECSLPGVNPTVLLIFFFVSFILTLSTFTSLAKNGARHVWFVSTEGKSNATGTKEDPFCTLEQARDAVRKLSKGNNPTENRTFTIFLRQGFYPLSESFRLNEKDAGSKRGPIVYKAFDGERVSITGAIRVNPGLVKPIFNPEDQKRIIDASARGQIQEIDLHGLNISDTIRWRLAGFSRPYTESGIELFINGKPYQLAGYPNNDKIQIHPADVVDPGIKDNISYPGKIRFPSDRIKYWPRVSEAMVFGCFTYAWASDQLRIASIDPDKQEIAFADAHIYGIIGEKEWNKYRIFNLLEELDAPGEYYVDRKVQKLYYYPYTAPSQSDTILISSLGTPLVQIENSANIHFEGITFEAGRGIGVSIVNGENNLLKGCTFRNLGMLAVRIGQGFDSFGENQNNFNCKGGKNNGVLNCWIENIGSGGIDLGGGDRKTLEPAGNWISDCEFIHCGRLTYSYKCPVNIHGVGNVIRHCNFNESPATEIYLHGNNHLIEFNMIQDACTFMDDQGAFYMGRNPSESGNVVRYNLFKNTGRFGITMAVYLDDGACGTSVYGNIFYKAGSRTIMMGGGSYNPMIANIFIDSPMAIHLDNRLAGWAKEWLQPGDFFDKGLKEINFQNPPYSIRYPELPNYFGNHPEQPKENDISHNLFVNVKMIHNGKAEWGPVMGNNRSINQKMGLEKIHTLKWTGKEIRSIREQIPDFKPVDSREIGRREVH